MLHEGLAGREPHEAAYQDEAVHSQLADRGHAKVRSSMASNTQRSESRAPVIAEVLAIRHACQEKAQ